MIYCKILQRSADIRNERAGREIMKKFDPTDLKPCPHMRGLVSAHVDGNLHGIAEWYTDLHIKGCPQCQASIPFLKSLKDRLSDLDVTGNDEAVDEVQRKAVDEELVKADRANSA
jgi:hypothetical protein